jgi:uncharacterized protein
MPTFILVLLSSIASLTLLWWWRTDRRLREGRMAMTRLVIAVFVVFVLGGLASVIVSRFGLDGLGGSVPKFVGASVLLWSLFVLPISLVLMTITGVLLMWADWRRKHRLNRQADTTASNEAIDSEVAPAPAQIVVSEPSPAQVAHDHRMLTRRGFLTLSAAMVPPALTFGATGVGLEQLKHFRIRKLIVPIAGLPSGIDGLTIAHVSDTHVGSLTHGNKLSAISDAVNDLSADFVLHTGDIINNDQRDLVPAFEMMNAMRGKHGKWMCEGNHDIIEGRSGFERFVMGQRMPVLLDESRIARVNNVDVQIMGIRWRRPARETGIRMETALSEDVKKIAQQRQAGAFPILLAHHPHAFDAAIENDLPLTLAGHTHGGQLALSHNIGFGPLMYKYWSGLYEQNGKACVVSNGTGNWFPLRINVPAEIVHITLKRA